ncbi:MAG: hypothetical protein HQM09_03230 [Candidatus Riflebacteria bacterium]|nr:hypothetical protein [Candidatus Riflebacteria bacterium]
MNNEQRQNIEAFINEADSSREADDWSAVKQNCLKALEEYVRLEDEEDVIVTPEDKDLKAKLEKFITEADGKLALVQRDLGMAALAGKDYSRAVDALEEAIDLAAETDVAFLESVKKDLDKARIREHNQKIYREITPFVTRGDEFRNEGNFGEAILEYQEALALTVGLPAEHRFLNYIHEAVLEARRELVKPYMGRISRAVDTGKLSYAYKLLQRAQLLIGNDDTIYLAFFEQIKENIAKSLSAEDREDVEEVEAPDDWSQAVKDYEEALNLYSSYSVADPLAPAYRDGNIYEDRFVASRRKLAMLYYKRAERLKEKAEFSRALKNFKEALKLLPREDDEIRHKSFRQIRELRAQLSARTG